MSSLTPPQLPPYRITLFYGPEPVQGSPARVSCIFNVKKRSWKGGVQVVVEADESQLAEIRRIIQFEPWLKTALASIPEANRAEYESRARDLFVQGTCGIQLDLALEAGLREKNCRIASDALVRKLTQAALERADRIKAQILTQLDLEEPT